MDFLFIILALADIVVLVSSIAIFFTVKLIELSLDLFPEHVSPLAIAIYGLAHYETPIRERMREILAIPYMTQSLADEMNLLEKKLESLHIATNKGVVHWIGYKFGYVETNRAIWVSLDDS